MYSSATGLKYSQRWEESFSFWTTQGMEARISESHPAHHHHEGLWLLSLLLADGLVQIISHPWAFGDIQFLDVSLPLLLLHHLLGNLVFVGIVGFLTKGGLPDLHRGLRIVYFQHLEHSEAVLRELELDEQVLSFISCLLRLVIWFSGLLSGYQRRIKDNQQTGKAAHNWEPTVWRSWIFFFEPRKVIGGLQTRTSRISWELSTEGG